MFTKFPPALYKGLAKQDGNLFMSPFSVQVALGMALMGAEGETYQKLAEAIDAPLDRPIRHYCSLIEEATPTNNEIELASANAAWIDERYKVKPTYTEALQSFGSDMQQVDYRQKDSTCNRINGWVSDKTATKIDKLVSPAAINTGTRLILTNAIYFKGKWDKPFSPERTKPQDFYLKEGKSWKPAKVPTMNQKANFRYFENELYQALEMPYKGLTTGMLIVLPKNKDDLLRFEKEWDDELYKLVLRDLSMEEVIVSVPKFKIATDVISLRDLLASDPPEGLGAGLAFSDYADFTGIGDERLKIDDVLHKAFVDVAEEGTEAAAATAVTMMKCTAMRPLIEPKRFIADHPFLFIIRNRKTDTILFQGRLTDPS
jgi:serpin B